MSEEQQGRLEGTESKQRRLYCADVSYHKEGQFTGNNWNIAYFGYDDDNNGAHWFLTTYYVHASELCDVCLGAKYDTLLVAKLLNDFWNTHTRQEAMEIALAEEQRELNEDVPIGANND